MTYLGLMSKVTANIDSICCYFAQGVKVSMAFQHFFQDMLHSNISQCKHIFEEMMYILLCLDSLAVLAKSRKNSIWL
jgi:hypothetical protein